MLIKKILSCSKKIHSSPLFYGLTSQYYFATKTNKCFYKVLNVSTDATPEEIKKSYLQLAKKYHPDVSSGEKVQEEKFKEISGAYQILSDPSKRQQYDMENGIISKKRAYEKTSREFKNEDSYSEWLNKETASNTKDKSEILDEYFQKKYFENKDFFKNKIDEENPWNLTRKLYNQHMDRKDQQKEDYVEFHPYTYKAYYEHKKDLEFDQNRHIIFKLMYDFKYLILIGFILFNIFILGNIIMKQNKEKTKVDEVNYVQEGKGIKTKLLPLNTA